MIVNVSRLMLGCKENHFEYLLHRYANILEKKLAIIRKHGHTQNLSPKRFPDATRHPVYYSFISSQQCLQPFSSFLSKRHLFSRNSMTLIHATVKFVCQNAESRKKQNKPTRVGGDATAEEEAKTKRRIKSVVSLPFLAVFIDVYPFFLCKMSPVCSFSFPLWRARQSPCWLQYFLSATIRRFEKAVSTALLICARYLQKVEIRSQTLFRLQIGILDIPSIQE